MRYINEIIIHCTSTYPKQDIGAKEIRAWHRANGWKDCGYHYIVRLDGTVERGRYVSQPGAHCRGHNAHSIGIAYVGGLDEQGRPTDTRTREQRASLLKLVTQLTTLYHCKTTGHNDHNPNKACPCYDAKNEYKNILKQTVSRK